MLLLWIQNLQISIPNFRYFESLHRKIFYELCCFTGHLHQFCHLPNSPRWISLLFFPVLIMMVMVVHLRLVFVNDRCSVNLDRNFPLILFLVDRWRWWPLIQGSRYNFWICIGWSTAFILVNRLTTYECTSACVYGERMGLYCTPDTQR